MNLTGPAVIIGHPNSLFPRELASHWRSRGMRVIIVTRHWVGETTLPDGTRLVASADQESTLARSCLSVLHWLLAQIERLDRKIEKRRHRRAMGASEKDYHPSFVHPLVNSLSIAHSVRSLQPRFVFGQEAFAHGLATALCFGFPRILMPWGGDIYRYSETSAISFAMVKHAFQHVDMIVPSSVMAEEHIRTRFRVPESKVKAVSWGVDRRMFSRADREQRESVCAQLGIDPTATVFTNVRRFLPAWGCEVALETFVRLAEECPFAHFVILGGENTESYVNDARQQVAQRGLSRRFTFFDGVIPLSRYALLMSVSDIFVSLMRKRDMRSWSILQAASAGGVPVLGDQEEYRAMERLGFRALFVNPDSTDSVVEALRICANDEALRSEIVSQNLEYIAEYEDYGCQMKKLLDLIDAVCQPYPEA